MLNVQVLAGLVGTAGLCAYTAKVFNGVDTNAGWLLMPYAAWLMVCAAFQAEIMCPCCKKDAKK